VEGHARYTRETVERDKSSSVAVLDTLKPVRLAPTTIPCSKAVKYFVLPIHPLNGTLTVHVSIYSRLKNPSLTCLLPFIYTEVEYFFKGVFFLKPLFN
jgi:hypothetical protein